MSIPLSDTVRRILVGLGYNITRSFSPSIAPLQILDKSSQANVFEVIGEASEIFYEPENIPEIKEGLTIVDISGESTTNLSINLTISFLEDFLKNSIFGKAELTGAFTNVRTFTTKFSKCSSDVVFPLETSKFLRKSSQGGINESEFVTSRILGNQDSRYKISDRTLVFPNSDRTVLFSIAIALHPTVAQPMEKRAHHGVRVAYVSKTS